MTAHDIIKSALRLIGAIGAGETPEAAMSADGLEAFQLLVDSWSGQGLMVYAQTKEDFPLTGAASYTIGSGGDFDTGRPESIIDAYVSMGGLDYPLTIIDGNKYARIAQKDISGIPSWLFYSPEYPLGIIYIYTLAGTGSTLNIDSLKELTSPTALTTTISFPPGYKLAMKYVLAAHLAPEYGRQVDQAIFKIAVDALDSIKSKNASARAQTVSLDMYVSNRRAGAYSINGG
jgi:hypothetical protein